jgi:hypothetical protein
MDSILGVEAVNKLDGMDLSMLTKYVEELSIKAPEIMQPKKPSQRELIDSPSTPRRKSISITYKNVK